MLAKKSNLVATAIAVLDIFCVAHLVVGRPVHRYTPEISPSFFITFGPIIIVCLKHMDLRNCLMNSIIHGLINIPIIINCLPIQIAVMLSVLKDKQLFCHFHFLIKYTFYYLKISFMIINIMIKSKLTLLNQHRSTLPCTQSCTPGSS